MPKRFRQGEHICAIYDGEEEQIALAVEYLADALRGGEKCLYIAQSPAALQQFRSALQDAGINVNDVIARGALTQATHAEAHLEGGYFDSERMLRLLNEAVDAALRQGFAGFRVCGDMSWLLEGALGSEQVVQYEAFLNEFFEGLPAAAMCQYDRRRLPGDLVDHGLCTHSSVVYAGRHVLNPFLRPRADAITREPQPHDVDSKLDRLRGF